MLIQLKRKQKESTHTNGRTSSLSSARWQKALRLWYDQRWASTLTSRLNARHWSKTRHSNERSERSYFFEKPKAKVLPSAVIFVDCWRSRFLGIKFFTFNEKNIAPYTLTFPKVSVCWCWSRSRHTSIIQGGSGGQGRGGGFIVRWRLRSPGIVSM